MTEFSSLAVFCGSRLGTDPAHREAARRLGRLMAERRIRLVFGGGAIGLMGVIADSALAAGGEAVGVIPDFLVKYELAHRGLTEIVVVDSMHERKRRMFELADGFVVLPGGLGTLDEAIEIVTWKQLRLHAKPIVVVDVAGYWRPLEAMFASVVAAGFAHPGIADLAQVVGRVEDLFAALAAAPAPAAEILTSHF